MDERRRQVRGDAIVLGVLSYVCFVVSLVYLAMVYEVIVLDVDFFCVITHVLAIVFLVAPCNFLGGRACGLYRVYYLDLWIATFGLSAIIGQGASWLVFNIIFSEHSGAAWMWIMIWFMVAPPSAIVGFMSARRPTEKRQPPMTVGGQMAGETGPAERKE